MSFRAEDSLYATSAQQFFTYMGYYANAFARQSGRDIERLTRPLPQDEGYWEETAERVKSLISAAISIPLAALLFIPSFTSYGIASCVGGHGFEFLEPDDPVEFWQQRSLKILSLNACLQDPWSLLSGGMVSPFEPVADQPSRIAAIVEAVAEENPTIFFGQEFDNLGAQDEAIRLLKQKGFSYFLRDLGSSDPIRNHSGLFVASQIPLHNIEFIPYPSQDRSGLAKWSNQGALTFTVSLQGREFRFVNVHLNYGIGEEDQNARNRQLKNHVLPLLNGGPALLLGDLNFNTAKIDPENSGLTGLTNALEGVTTYTDEGQHTLRGKERNPGGVPCTDCQESIDGLIYHPERVLVVDAFAKPLIANNQLLSDHFAAVASVQIHDVL